MRGMAIIALTLVGAEVFLAPGVSAQGHPGLYGQATEYAGTGGAMGRGGRGRGRFMQRFDANGDGQLSDEERAQARAFRAQFDRNGDGRIDRDERQAARQSLGAGAGGGSCGPGNGPRGRRGGRLGGQMGGSMAGRMAGQMGGRFGGPGAGGPQFRPPGAGFAPPAGPSQAGFDPAAAGQPVPEYGGFPDFPPPAQ